jgi:enamine deaminase RidA (YjgF/YER057c/UK114 family)
MALQGGSAEERVKALGIELGEGPSPLGAYVEAVETGRLLFLSGVLPVADGKPAFVGRIGKELTAEEGRAAARIAAVNVLAAARKKLGSLDKVTRVVRLGVFLASAGEYDMPRVADGASELLKDVFGEERLPVRSVIGVASLPLGMPVELEVTMEVGAER